VTDIGVASGYAPLASDVINSIMFPTVFSAASEGSGRRTAARLDVICVLDVGGAVVPLVRVHFADLEGLMPAILRLPFVAPDSQLWRL
jgi:FHS family L-fucose permease-like MFS transporter